MIQIYLTENYAEQSVFTRVGARKGQLFRTICAILAPKTWASSPLRFQLKNCIYFSYTYKLFVLNLKLKNKVENLFFEIKMLLSLTLRATLFH